MPYANPNYGQAESQHHAPPSNSVPPGHRAKCRSCGAVDNVAYRGVNRRAARCGACGSTIARRRAPRAPKIVSFVVVRQLNGASWGDLACVDLYTAEREALTFCERGPVARSRVAAVVELLDDERTGSVRVLRYENYKQRHSSVTWESGCESCKGRGLLSVVLKPASGEEKAVRGFVACGSCGGLGGELTRKMWMGRLK